MSQLPAWAVLTVGFAAPLAAFVGVMIGHVLTRQSHRDNDRWRRREESMRMLRWAAEMALDPEERTRLVGAAALEALVYSEMLQPEDDAFLDAITLAALGDTLEAFDVVGYGSVVEAQPDDEGEKT